MNAFRAERAVSPLDGSELWVVLDCGFVMHREASDFLRALHGAGRSPQTVRAYAGRVASFLGWCADQGVQWSSISLPDLARFKHFVEATPHRDGRLRSGATVNAILTAVCEFLRSLRQDRGDRPGRGRPAIRTSLAAVRPAGF